MESTVVERAALPGKSEDREMSFPNVESIVMDCISATVDPFSVQQKLMGTIAQAMKDIPQLGEAQACMYVKCLVSIAKGLRKNTEENHTFRFFCFGQFQAHVEQLEQELEHSFSEARILSVANRKYFAPIMQLLYTEQVCQQQRIADRLKVDRSNLSRELRRLVDSGLVEVSAVDRFRYYRLTSQGRRYYNTYLVMKNQLEEQIYSPRGERSPIKELSSQYFLLLEADSQDCFPPNSYKKEIRFTDDDAKSRTDMIYNYDLRRST